MLGSNQMSERSKFLLCFIPCFAAFCISGSTLIKSLVKEQIPVANALGSGVVMILSGALCIKQLDIDL
jgi:hypothetical protein